MDLIIKIINSGWFSSLIGILGVSSGVIFYFLSKDRTRISSQTVANRIIGTKEASLPTDVTVLFKEKKVDRVNKVRCVIWNSGSVTVRGADIVDNDPLRIEFIDDTNILKAEIAEVTREINDFKCFVFRENSVTVKFDYIDAGDGAVIEILHTSDNILPEIKGSIKGMPRGVKMISVSSVLDPFVSSIFGQAIRRKSQRKIMYILSSILALGCLFVALFGPPSWDDKTNNMVFGISIGRFAVGLLGISYATLPIFLYASTRKRYPRGLNLID